MPLNDQARLVVTVTGEREIHMTRTFNAPRELVFDVYTRPEHIRHWWGLRGSEISVCEVDLRPGGAYRYVTREADGNEYGFHGVYREVVRPERLVATFEFEGMPGHVSVDTTVFEDHNGTTLLVGSSVFDSIEDRDGMIASGMEDGAGQSYDRLAEYLATLT